MSSLLQALSSKQAPICLLLLCASAINYMDRQTLANAASRITTEFEISKTQYGSLEAGFGWAFAAGSLVFGFLADRLSVRKLYACVVVAWSLAGIASGYSHTYLQLLAARTLLGFFEAAHWPCGIKVIRAIMQASNRAAGNGILQSGTSLGAICTPLIMAAMMTNEAGSWRLPFRLIGLVGMIWAAAWWLITTEDEIKENSADHAGREVFPKELFGRKMLVVLVVIALINTTWQLLRAWLPQFLQEGRGYSELHALRINAVWFAATDVGCLCAGGLATWFAAQGIQVRRSRLIAFGLSAVGCLLLLGIPGLPRGPLLLVVLMLAGAGALGVFPIYHAFTQDVSARNQGLVTGVAGVAAWLFSPLAQLLFGRLVDRTHSYDWVLATAGCLPGVAWLLLVIFWPHELRLQEKPNAKP